MVQAYKSELIQVSKIKTDNSNPNQMTKETMERLKKSMEKFGNLHPIVVDKKTMLIADGEHRLQVYKEMGLKEIPAILKTFSSDEERRAYRQAANKLRGSHNDELDAKEYQKILAAIDAEMLWVVTGLKESQVERHIRLYGELEPPKDLTEDGFDLNARHSPKYAIKTGESWKLGEHRLICGNSLDLDLVSRFVGKNKADLVWIDPPYNLDFAGTTDKFVGFANDKLKEDEYDKFCKDLAKAFTESSAEHASIYLAIDYRNYPLWARILAESGWKQFNCIVWDKVFAGLGQKYRFRHEFIIYGAKDTANAVWRGDGGNEDVIVINPEQNHSMRPLDKKGTILKLGNALVHIKLIEEAPKRMDVLEGGGEIHVLA